MKKFNENLLKIAAPLEERKVCCQIVYKSSVNKINTTTGIIRDVLLKKEEILLVLENGLPIELSSVLSIKPLEEDN